MGFFCAPLRLEVTSAQVSGLVDFLMNFKWNNGMERRSHKTRSYKIAWQQRVRFVCDQLLQTVK